MNKEVKYTIENDSCSISVSDKGEYPFKIKFDGEYSQSIELNANMMSLLKKTLESWY